MFLQILDAPGWNLEGTQIGFDRITAVMSVRSVDFSPQNTGDESPHYKPFLLLVIDKI